MADSELNYKELLESFMANHNGTSVAENVLVLSPAPFTVFISCYLTSLLSPRVECRALIRILLYIVEFSCIVCMQILCFTSLNEIVFLVVLILVGAYVFIMGYEVLMKGVHRSYSNPNKYHRPFVTYFRSLVSILSAICILAVDFKIFPRRFAKTETFGFSLMDTGVGFFIVSNGMVVKPRSESSPTNNLILKSILSSFPLLALGFIRFFSVETIDYQKHVTEYGVHWNFFFTLAGVKCLASVLLSLWPKQALLMSLLISYNYQLLLMVGVQDWILGSTPRQDFLSANREGILSLFGYLSLFLSSVYLGERLRLNRGTLKEDISTMTGLWNTSIFFFILTVLSNRTFEVSRRLVNVTYLFWIGALSTLFLTILMVVEISLVYILKPSDQKYICPSILQSVSYNNLTFFLVANLCTGLINMCIKTLYIAEVPSLAIIMLYMFVVCCFVSLLFRKEIKIKFW